MTTRVKPNRMAAAKPSMVRMFLKASPVKDFGPNQPGLYRLKASDANRDGHIEIAVASPPSAEDHNAVLNMLWVFEGDPPADLDILAGHLAVKSRADAFFAGVVPPQRRVVVLERRGAGRDHPVLLGVPETGYLKCFVLQALE